MGEVIGQFAKIAKGSEPFSFSQLPEHPDFQPPAPVVQHLHVHTTQTDFFERVRLKALAAAKEAYRDVILEAADQAKSKGDKDLAIRLYDDFIHMEQGLKVIYEGK